MPEYLSPGVYVEEVDAGPKPIEGVSTSTAGAVGVTARGPDTGKPILVTSYAEYVRTFGGPVAVENPQGYFRGPRADPGQFGTVADLTVADAVALHAARAAAVLEENLAARGVALVE